MAVDAALLRWVSLGHARLVFRTYGWDRPTLSLGHSEPFPAGWDERALTREGIAVTRRPTGGNAVLHWEEVAVAVAASIPGPWRLTPRGFANATAEALAEALRACGVEATRVESSGPRVGAPKLGEAPCFARSESGEVGAAGYKVAGLASRFSRTGALCHASVPLSARHREVVSFRAGERTPRHRSRLTRARSGNCSASRRTAPGPWTGSQGSYPTGSRKRWGRGSTCPWSRLRSRCWVSKRSPCRRPHRPAQCDGVQVGAARGVDRPHHLRRGDGAGRGRVRREPEAAVLCGRMGSSLSRDSRSGAEARTMARGRDARHDRRGFVSRPAASSPGGRAGALGFRAVGSFLLRVSQTLDRLSGALGRYGYRVSRAQAVDRSGMVRVRCVDGLRGVGAGVVSSK